jgi:hypothetical protein
VPAVNRVRLVGHDVGRRARQVRWGFQCALPVML